MFLEIYMKPDYDALHQTYGTDTFDDDKEKKEKNVFMPVASVSEPSTTSHFSPTHPSL